MDSGTVRVVAGVLAVGAGVASVVASCGGWWWRSRKATPPMRWVPVGVVSRLCVYPLKSGKAVELETATCGPFGLAWEDVKDRMFVVIDSNGKCISGRVYPKMTQIAAEVRGRRLRLYAVDRSRAIDVPLPSAGEPVRIRIWDAPAEGLDCGCEVSDWLTRYLGATTRLRLLYRSDESTGKDFNPGMKKAMKVLNVKPAKADAGLFSDTFAYHLVSESSVKHVNRQMERAEDAVTPLHFRPNIVVKGNVEPFEEDRWRFVKIGDVVFEFLAPCMRCSFTTIDPATGKRSKQREPIATLRRYRMVQDERLRELVKAPTMGIYLGVRREGRICVDDIVYAGKNVN